jgi:transaldolase
MARILAGMKEMAANPMIKGFTTNPTLMRKAGIADYKAFAARRAGGDTGPPGVLRGLRRRFPDDGSAGARNRLLEQAREREDPVTNSKSEFSGPLDRAALQSRACS